MGIPGFHAGASVYHTNLKYIGGPSRSGENTTVYPQACACPDVADSVCPLCAFPLANAEALCLPLLLFGCDAFLKCIFGQLVVLAPFCLGTATGPAPGCLAFAKEVFCAPDGSVGPPPPPGCCPQGFKCCGSCATGKCDDRCVPEGAQCP